MAKILCPWLKRGTTGLLTNHNLSVNYIVTKISFTGSIKRGTTTCEKVTTMKSQQAALARRSLDNRVGADSGVLTETLARPAGGWIRGIRSALGMSAEQLGNRLGTTRQAVSALERSEIDGGLRLSSLQRAAEALDCHLVYALVPNTSFEESVQRQALRVATGQIASVDQTMLLEGQRVGDAEVAAQRNERLAALVGSRHLWDQMP